MSAQSVGGIRSRCPWVCRSKCGGVLLALYSQMLVSVMCKAERLVGGGSQTVERSWVERDATEIKVIRIKDTCGSS